ncbi:MAG TPA: LysR family transcriptional regulator [Eoetvoesiella sp.]
MERSPTHFSFAQLRIKHLTLLDLISTHGSLRKVGEAMHLTQPAITAMLKDLESAFDASLVNRDRQGATLTPSGVATRARLEAILNELQAARHANTVSKNGSFLRIGALPAAMIGLVPEVIAVIQKQGLPIALKFIESTVEQAMSSLFNNELDCVIGRLDAKTLLSFPDQEFSFDKLLSMGLQVACGRNNPFSSRKMLTLEDLAEQKWALLSVDSQSRSAFDQAFIQRGMAPPQPVVESLSFLSNFHMVSISSLLTIAPMSAVSKFQKLKMVRKVPYEWPISSSPLLLITKKDKHKIDALVQFRKVLMTCAKNIEANPLR